MGSPKDRLISHDITLGNCKTFLKLNSAETKIFHSHKCYNAHNFKIYHQHKLLTGDLNL